jgi:Protein of Unknown function (DUF2784)
MPALLADAVVVLHFAYVSFAVGGEILILAGGLLGWRWVRNLPFRLVHLAAVVLVAVEALLPSYRLGVPAARAGRPAGGAAAVLRGPAGTVDHLLRLPLLGLYFGLRGVRCAGGGQLAANPSMAPQAIECNHSAVTRS